MSQLTFCSNKILLCSIGNGGWISDGVRTVGSSGHSQGRTTVQCESTHLTSFAVLVDVHGVRKHMHYMKSVSDRNWTEYFIQFSGTFSAGSSASCLLHWVCHIPQLSSCCSGFLLVPKVILWCSWFICCCILMADNLVSHRKKLFTKNSIHFVHLNLTTTLFLAYLTFVVGIELARGHKVSECGCFLHENMFMSYWNESATLVLLHVDLPSIEYRIYDKIVI